MARQTDNEAFAVGDTVVYNGSITRYQGRVYTLAGFYPNHQEPERGWELRVADELNDEPMKFGDPGRVLWNVHTRSISHYGERGESDVV